jgi:predicted carbohydrate-binding protein with CBM5 and CBM33 domain
MRMHHTPSHWVVVALVLLALLLTLREAHGQTQSPGAAAVFEGRPAVAGAQAGLGAQAGPPQGGIGVQGAEAAERGVHVRRPSGAADMPQGQPAAATDVAAAAPAGQLVKPKDTGVAREQRSAVRKAKRAAKRTVRRARTGTAEIDAR